MAGVNVLIWILAQCNAMVDVVGDIGPSAGYVAFQVWSARPIERGGGSPYPNPASGRDFSGDGRALQWPNLDARLGDSPLPITRTISHPIAFKSVLAAQLG